MRNPPAATLRRMDRLDRLYRQARDRGLPPREAERAAMESARRRRRRNPSHADWLDLLLPAVFLYLLVRGGRIQLDT